MLRSARGFRRFAWGVLAYTLFVILWGGYVRASGSGAGCGDHWPLCNGDVIPRAPEMATLVEFGHRVTSGLAGLASVLLLVWAFRAYPAGSPVRKGALFGFAFMMTEALIGAGLVLFEYVAFDASTARAYWMAAHLGNTFLLLAALGLTAWWASGGRVPSLAAGPHRTLTMASLVGLFVLGISGAVTALGDTLVLAGGLDPAEVPIVATLVGLRIVHPLLACAVVGLFALAAYRVRRDAPGGRAAFIGLTVLAIMLVQLMVGLVNVELLAPVPLQLVHLFLTDLIWLGAVFFAAEALAPAPVVERRTVGVAA